MTDIEKVDLVVVGNRPCTEHVCSDLRSHLQRLTPSTLSGSGWHGLAAAKTYLEVHPHAEFVIYESASTVGGTWANERLYPGLKSNNMLGTYEYSDYPMDTETYGVKPGEHIPGHVIHKYLSNFAESHGIHQRIRFDTNVQSARHVEGGGWLITVSRSIDDGGPEFCEIFASKLIAATGLTSTPSVPKFPGSKSFEVPLFHCKDFPKYASTTDTTRNVCVFGGTKSAWDVVYAYGSKGVRVDWVIRASGHGPTWMAPPYVTPFKIWLEKLLHTRFLTWFSPCIWGDADGYAGIRSLLHRTGLGRFIVDKFWKILGADVLSLNKYDSHPQTSKLKPWSNPFFVASGLSILNYDKDFFDLVRSGIVQVHIADITELSQRTVCLSTGDRIPTDALVYCTGWKHTVPFNLLPKDLNLGLPYKAASGEPRNLVERADQEILSLFPRLRNQPPRNPKYKPLSKINTEEGLEPYRLYRFMVPPKHVESRDIAFVGSLMSLSTSLCSQLQALWVTAFFGNQLPISTDFFYESVLHSRFGKWRCPSGFGDRFPDIAFDALPYLDMLLSDLGLNRHRKRTAIAEVFLPYGPADYTGIVNEWLATKTGDHSGARQAPS